MQRNKLETLALLLPFLGLLIWTVSVSLSHSTGGGGRIKIVGYDPVDILSGHYLRFRYDFGPRNLCQNQNQSNVPLCVCLHQDENQVYTAVEPFPCTGVENICKEYVRGTCQSGTFLTGSERYYFPETYASVLSLVPEDSYAEVKIGESGTIALRDIFVGQQTIKEYAKMKLEEPKP